MHDGIEKCFKRKPTKDGVQDLIEALDIVWRQKEGQAAQDASRIRHRIRAIETTIANQVEAATDPDNALIKVNILDAVKNKQKEIEGLENELTQLQSLSDDDRAHFLRFAFDFINNTGKHFLDPELSQENRIRCKQILFPAGFYVDANQNVYTPEISTLYRLATNKKDTEVSLNSHLVRVQGL